MEFLRGQLPEGANFELENLVVVIRAGTDVDLSGLSDEALRALRMALLDELLGSCRLMNGMELKSLDNFARTILSQA